MNIPCARYEYSQPIAHDAMEIQSNGGSYSLIIYEEYTTFYLNMSVVKNINIISTYQIV